MALDSASRINFKRSWVIVIVKTRSEVGKRIYKVPEGWKYVSLEGWGEGYVQMRIQRIAISESLAQATPSVATRVPEAAGVVLLQKQPNMPEAAEVPAERS